jgi:exodeoxyribonuclease V beta subunit
VAPLAEDELPRGAATGTFLHQLLEEIPIASFEARSLDAWRARDEVKLLFDEALRRRGIDPRHRAHAERLVHTAFTAPVRLGPPGDVRLDRGLAAASRHLRELEFVYPYPELAHPPLSETPDRPFVIERGYVTGFVDLVFEHDGRVYFADWKSDTLDGWAPESLRAHVGEQYRLQAQLYSLALVKLLAIRDARDYERRFGGMLFCFLRGMRPGLQGADGICFDKPSWDEVCGWERQLRSDGGGA